MIRRTIALAALVVGAVGCSDSGPAVAPSQTRIAIDNIIAASSAAPTLYASVNGVLVAVSPDTVQSLTIEFTDIAYLATGGDENTADAWQTLSLGDPVTLDLMALPAVQDGSVVIGSGSVPVGSYKMVRLMTGTGEITFKGPLNFGGGAKFDGGTAYPVTIPSGDQTGLKTDVSFEVTEGQDGTANAAYLVFEPGTTFQNVTATGNGGVMLAPVITSK